MRYELIIHNGIPAWWYSDGTVLPVMAGGDADEEALAALAALLGGGQEMKLDDLLGRTFADPTTQFAGTLKRRTDRRTGKTVYYLVGAGGRAQNLSKGGQLIDATTRQWLDLLPGGGDIWTYGTPKYTGGKASESDIERLFGLGTGGGGGGGGGYAAPQWRPGELELEQKALEQRLQELQMGFDADSKAAILAHENKLKLLEMEMAHADEQQKVRIQAEIDLENLRHENDMAELRERIEAEQKNLVFSEGMATGRTLIQEQGAMKRELLGLGPDPFAQAAGLTGQVTRGITPQQTAVRGAREFIGQPIPQMNMDMTVPEMQAALTGMGGIQAPSFGGFGMSGTIGMAKGGTVKTRKGKQQSVIVGEAGKEIVTGSDFQVTPLVGAAQYGARIGGIGTINWDDLTPEKQPHIALPLPPPTSTVPGRQPWGPTIGGIGPPPPGFTPPPAGTPRPTWIDPALIQSILQGLAPMYEGSAFGQVPTAQGYGGGFRWETPNAPTGFQPGGGMSPLGAYSELGIAPQLIRNQAGHTWYIQGGKRHYIMGGHNPDTLVGLGLNPSQVVMVSDAGINKYPPGGNYTGQGAQAAGAVTGQEGYGALGSPLIEQTSGALLMSPHKIAGNWQGMSPIEQQVMLSAYKSAGGPTGFGLSPETVLDMMQTFTPAGRGYGRRIGGIGGQF